MRVVVGLMFNGDYLLRFALVGLGAIPGSWLRFGLTNYLRSALPRRYLPTMLVNVVSAFLLGLLMSIASKSGGLASSYFLLLGIGFLGSFSTFSAFALDLLEELRLQAWGDSLFLLVGSVVGGIIFAAIGYGLANV